MTLYQYYAVKNRSQFLQGKVWMHKTRCGGLCICICFKPSNSLEYVTAKYWQNRKTSDKVITNI